MKCMLEKEKRESCLHPRNYFRHIWPIYKMVYEVVALIIVHIERNGKWAGFF